MKTVKFIQIESIHDLENTVTNKFLHKMADFDTVIGLTKLILCHEWNVIMWLWSTCSKTDVCSLYTFYHYRQIGFTKLHCGFFKYILIIFSNQLWLFAQCTLTPLRVSYVCKLHVIVTSLPLSVLTMLQIRCTHLYCQWTHQKLLTDSTADKRVTNTPTVVPQSHYSHT